MDPLISIGMSVLNCEDTVAVAIVSILKQSFQDWELIVIDDGSEDGTTEVLSQFRDPRILVVRDRVRRGLPTRLNQAISMSKGKYFARMDGDDVSYPSRLQTQLGFISADSNLDLIGGGILLRTKAGEVIGKRIPPKDHTDICRRPYVGFPIVHPTFFGRLDWFKSNRYNVNAIRCEDQELLLRTYKRSKFGNLNSVVLGYCEQTDLRKITRGRWYFTQLMFKEYLRKREILLGLRGFAEHGMRAMLELSAFSMGFGGQIMKRRNQLCSLNDLNQWRMVEKLVLTTHL